MNSQCALILGHFGLRGTLYERAGFGHCTFLFTSLFTSFSTLVNAESRPPGSGFRSGSRSVAASAASPRPPLLHALAGKLTKPTLLGLHLSSNTDALDVNSRESLSFSFCFTKIRGVSATLGSIARRASGLVCVAFTVSD